MPPSRVEGGLLGWKSVVWQGGSNPPGWVRSCRSSTRVTPTALARLAPSGLNLDAPASRNCLSPSTRYRHKIYPAEIIRQTMHTDFGLYLAKAMVGGESKISTVSEGGFRRSWGHTLIGPENHFSPFEIADLNQGWVDPECCSGRVCPRPRSERPETIGADFGPSALISHRPNVFSIITWLAAASCSFSGNASAMSATEWSFSRETWTVSWTPAGT